MANAEKLTQIATSIVVEKATKDKLTVLKRQQQESEKQARHPKEEASGPQDEKLRIHLSLCVSITHDRQEGGLRSHQGGPRSTAYGLWGPLLSSRLPSSPPSDVQISSGSEESDPDE
ncbi:hypothetical protein Emag_007077 [Eimeria magna]